MALAISEQIDVKVVALHGFVMHRLASMWIANCNACAIYMIIYLNSHCQSRQWLISHASHATHVKISSLADVESKESICRGARRCSNEAILHV